MLEEMSSTKSAHLVEVVGATQINTPGSTNMAVECLTDEEILSEKRLVDNSLAVRYNRHIRTETLPSRYQL